MLQNLEHVFVFVFVFSPNLIGYSLKLIWLLFCFIVAFLVVGKICKKMHDSWV